LYAAAISFFELLAVAVIISCVFFLLRRNVLKLSRFWKKEMEGWPFLDANIILWVEILLMTALLIMNMADVNLQQLHNTHYQQAGPFLISGLLAPVFTGMPENTLIAIERSAWWLHLVGILAFLNYVPYSKHLHIILAFPNTYFGNIKPAGEIDNMNEIANEVKLMLQPDAVTENTDPLPENYRFGAKDVTDLSWKSLLDAYSCTECGRCTAVCPASQSGKKLSPRKIMMDTRDRIEEVSKVNENNDDNRALYGTYITKEEIMACTTCQACVQECPVNINPLHIIMELRRYIAMEEAATPAEWNTMFTNMENNAAPWQFSPEERLNWIKT